MKNGFCDYCDTLDVFSGEERTDLSHAQAVDGRWICDQCYYFWICTTSKNNPNVLGPCKDKCSHRPSLMTKWATF